MSLFSELKRRNVIRVAAAYVVAAWLIIQVVETLSPAFGFGDSAVRYAFILLAIAFVPAVMFSWAFELTPGGLKREVDVAEEVSITRHTAKRLDRFLIVLLAIALSYFAFDKFVLEPARDQELVEETVQKAQSDAFVKSFGENSIAVLPFVNMSADPEQEYFSDGISEELLNLLARIPRLRVISRSSAFSFKGRDIPVPEIAVQLNVAHVLEGSVRKSGNRVRISAQLVEARSDSQLWSETYDRDLTARNLFAIQSEIAQNISLALDSVLTAGDRQRLSEVPTESLDAYYAYHLGRQRMIRRNVNALEQAIGLFRQAIELDPDYALAYVGLADAYMLLGDYGDLGLEDMVGLAEPALSRALELDSQLAAAYATQGAIRTKMADFTAAEAAYRRAIELDPNDATAYHWYGDSLISYLRRPGEAAPLLEQALALDPLSPAITVTLGEAYAGLERFEDAKTQYGRAMEIDPDYPGAYMLMARLLHSVEGRLDEAVRLRKEGLLRNPRQVFALSSQALLFLDLGDDDRAAALVGQALALSPDHAWSNRARLYLHLYRGQRNEALDSARRLLSISPRNNASLYALARLGEFGEALERMAADYPELSCDGEPAIDGSTVFQALNLSLALEKTGSVKCARTLLAGVQQQLEGMPRLGSRGFGVADAEVYARLGMADRALEVLRQAIDANWRAYWWSQAEQSPHMESLRGEPAFQAMMQEIRDDMAAQLARLNAMEDRRDRAVR